MCIVLRIGYLSGLREGTLERREQVAGGSELRVARTKRPFGTRSDSVDRAIARESPLDGTGRLRRRVGWIVVAVVLLVLVAVGGAFWLAWPDGVPFWGHPENETSVIGTWRGLYDNIGGKLILRPDHTYSLQLDGSTTLGARAIDGKWDYSDGALVLLPGLWVYNHDRTDEYVVQPQVELTVENTLFPWHHVIADSPGDSTGLGRISTGVD
jgi:hypothetical protein